jgi:hypothetical protein
MTVKMTLARATLDAGFRLPGESPGAFAAQLKRLSDADRKWFAERFLIERGIEIVAAV